MDPAQQLNQSLVGRYIIDREIGAGGMATVYLARDARHNRQVALKLLKPELGVVLGAERFLAEIQVTANLQHPNLLPLFDSGEADGLLFYVMPFVEGETLRARLDREKQLPVEDALRIATGIGGALAYAHSQGVIHRDLKPENILMHAGQPVIADFGIALAVSNAGGARITQTGLSLGTPMYMSPEQATGDRAIDGRTDMYSLAAMLYEMLTGDPPHTASTSQGIIAKVLTDRPRSVRSLRPSVPVHVEEALDRALEKLPADRWTNVQEFVDALRGRGITGASTRLTLAPQGLENRRPRHRDPVVVALALMAMLGVVTAAVMGRRGREPLAMTPVRFVLTPDTVAPPIFNGTWSVVPSPDAKSVLYTAAENGTPRLWVRRLDQLAARAIPGTERASQPLFSPDGKWVAFLADGKLRKVSLDGGAPVTLADAGANNGADWVTEDAIVLGSEGRFRGLSRLSAAGGAFQEFTNPDTAKGEMAHLWPVSLADGNTILFTIYDGKSKVGSHIGITTLKDGKVTDLGVVGIAPVGVFAEHLVYVQSDGTVMSVPIDVKGRRVIGSGMPVLDSIPVCPGCNGDAAIHASRSGSLAYMRGSTLSRMVWVDRAGNAKNIINEWAGYASPRISPDGTRIAVEISKGLSDVWVLTVANGTLSRLTSGGSNGAPEWSRDGQSIYYISERSGSKATILRQTADGGGKPEQIAFGVVSSLTLNPDGKSLIFTTFGSTLDLMLKTLGDSSKPRPFLATSDHESSPRFSPDGRWVAYVSTETGVDEVYVRPFVGDGGRVQISSGGGNEPLWSPDGKRIYYRSGRRMRFANVAATTGISVIARDSLFADPFARGSGTTVFDVARDESRFLMLRSNDEKMQVIIVANWIEELKARTGKR